MTTPPVTGQTLGIAYFAVRANLISALAELDLTFEQSTLLNYLGNETATPEALVAYAAGNLKVPAATIQESLAALVETGLVSVTDTEAALTEQGTEVATRLRARTAPLTASLFADIPADDLAATGRVLATLTERANAALAR